MMGNNSMNQFLQLKKIVMMMRLIYMTQVIVVLIIVAVSGFRYLVNQEIPTTQSILLLLVVMTVMVVFNGYFILKDSSVFRRLSSQIEIKDESYRNIEALNLELRAQRHDFLNHIQILYSLMELEAYEDTTAYLNRLYGDVGKVSANIKTSSVAVNALLQAKSNEAEVKGIHYSININSRLENMTMPDWELCRVIGNIIDNGFRAAENHKEDPKVIIDINENIVDYEVVVRNTSNPIEHRLIEKFFSPGITTKKNSENHGMGLYISRELLKKYENTIEMKYEEHLVIVTVKLHKSV